MADNNDIQIDLTSDSSQGEKAREVLQSMGDQAEKLAGELGQATAAQKNFTAATRDATAEAEKATRAAERLEAAQRKAAASAFSDYAGGGKSAGGGAGGAGAAPPAPTRSAAASAFSDYANTTPGQVQAQAAQSRKAADRASARAQAQADASKKAADRAGAKAKRQADATAAKTQQQANRSRKAADRARDQADADAEKARKKADRKAAQRSQESARKVARRSSAKARLGLAGANIAQDVAQGGPASAINNILGLAGDGGVKELISGSGIGRFTSQLYAAAGGIKGLAVGFGTMAVAAGAAYLVIGRGLEKAGLDWGDFTTVISDLGPVHAIGEAFAGIGQIAENWGITGAITGTYDALENAVGWVAQYTIGWGDATDAAKAHKDEVKAATEAVRENIEAQKTLAKLQSTEQKEKASRGKLVGDALANLGGAGGIDAVVDKLATKQTGKGADDKITVPKIATSGEKKGQVIGEEEITKREAARRRIQNDIAAATEGDTAALGRLKPYLKGAGYDLKAVESAEAGTDPKEVAKDKKTAADKAERDKVSKAAATRREGEAADREAAQEQEEAGRLHARRVDKLADPLQDRFNRLAAAGKAPGVGQIQGELQVAGLSPIAAQPLAPNVLDKLNKGYADAITKIAGETGLDRPGAAKKLLADDAKKEQDKQEAKDRKAEAVQSDRVKDARNRLSGTGLDDRTKDALLRRYLGGQDGDRASAGVAKALAAELERKGMGKEGAEAAAKDIVDSQRAEIGDELAKGGRGGKGADVQALRAPERIDAGSFAARVESSGADLQKRMLTTSESIDKRLGELVRLQNRGPRVGP